MSDREENPGGPAAVLVGRSVVGGVLMGLANLVPGISGGTMLLAAGVYPQFVGAVAQVTTFRFRRQSLLVLGLVGLSAAAAILLLAGPVKDLVVHHRWVMYSLFIGLTLGGVPVVWKLMEKLTSAVLVGAVVGFVAMTLLAWAQQQGLGSGGDDGSSFGMLFLAGIAGASAMILPGVSGGYLLLVLGQYVPILTGIDALKSALESGSLQALWPPVIGIVIPVGLGVLAGVVVVSNVLQLFLTRYRNATLGVLLGLLVGAVVGLWPFQESRPLVAGDSIKGVLVTETNVTSLNDSVDLEDLPSVAFQPSGSQLAGSLGLVVSGFLATALIARMGGKGAGLDQKRD